MSNTLKKVTARAKAVRRSHPGMSWKNALRHAGLELRNEKKGKKPRAKKPVTKKVARKKATAKGTVRGVGSFGGMMATKKIAAEVAVRNRSKQQIEALQRIKRENRNRLEAWQKKQIDDRIKYEKKVIQACNKNIANLKRLV